MNKIITKIPVNYKQDKGNKIKGIDTFKEYCNLLKISYTKNNEFDFCEKLKKIKEYHIKHFALNIHKKYINELDTCISNIEVNFNKLKDKITCVDFLLNNIELFKDINSNDLLSESNEISEDTIFLTSDENPTSVNFVKKPVNLPKSDYINIYSN